MAKTVYIVLGSPGAGKSHLLNGLLVDSQFVSGIAKAGAETVTTEWKWVHKGGKTYVDTPGIVDPNTISVDLKAKLVGELIKNECKEGARCTFLVLLKAEGGRFQKSEMDRACKILNAIPELSIINLIVQVPKKQFQAGEKDPTSRTIMEENLREQLGYFGGEKTLIKYVSKNGEWVDGENLKWNMVEDDPRLHEWIQTKALSVLISGSPVPEKRSKPIYYVCVGNPGAGKSTFLNGMAGMKLFTSGVSVTGVGVTADYLKFTPKGSQITYVDTPGLDDIKIQVKAADSIFKGLRSEHGGGDFKIFFVLTLDAGRVKSADMATIATVLRAAKEINKFNIVINKVSKNVESFWKVDGNKEKLDMEIRTGLERALGHKNFEYKQTHVGKRSKLDDEDDVCWSIRESEPELHAWIEREAYSGVLTANKVEKLDLSFYAAVKKAWETYLEKGLFALIGSWFS